MLREEKARLEARRFLPDIVGFGSGNGFTPAN